MDLNKKILELLEKGIITVDEAEELLDALSSDKEYEEYDEKTLKKIEKEFVKIYKKLEEEEKKLSDKLTNSDLSELKSKLNEKIKKFESKLNTIYNKSLKQNFDDLGNSLKKFGKNVCDAFKSKKENDENEKPMESGKYIELEEVQSEEDK